MNITKMTVKAQARFNSYVAGADALAAATTTAKQRKVLASLGYDVPKTDNAVADLTTDAIRSLRHQARAVKSTDLRKQNAAKSVKTTKRSRKAA